MSFEVLRTEMEIILILVYSSKGRNGVSDVSMINKIFKVSAVHLIHWKIFTADLCFWPDGLCSSTLHSSIWNVNVKRNQPWNIPETWWTVKGILKSI